MSQVPKVQPKPATDKNKSALEQNHTNQPPCGSCPPVR